jgi:hypothetical protein
MARAQISFLYKFSEGKKLRYKTTSKIHQAWTLMAMEIESEQEETIVSSRNVGKRRADSTLPVEEKVESLHTELSLPGGITVTYDSSEPNAKIDNPQLAFLGEIFKVMGEIGYTIVIDDKNKVKAVEGAEKILEKVDKLSAPAREALRSQLEGAKLKSKFEQAHGNLPGGLARPGERWERTEISNIGNDITLTFRKKYEYLGAETKLGRTLDRVSSKAFEVELKQDAGTKSQLKVVKSNLKVQSSEENILFDRLEGCVFEAKGNTHIKGPATISALGQDQTAELDMTLSVSTLLQQPTN